MISLISQLITVLPVLLLHMVAGYEKVSEGNIMGELQKKGGTQDN